MNDVRSSFAVQEAVGPSKSYIFLLTPCSYSAKKAFLLRKMALEKSPRIRDRATSSRLEAGLMAFGGSRTRRG